MLLSLDLLDNLQILIRVLHHVVGHAQLDYSLSVLLPLHGFNPQVQDVEPTLAEVVPPVHALGGLLLRLVLLDTLELPNLLEVAVFDDIAAYLLDAHDVLYFGLDANVLGDEVHLVRALLRYHAAEWHLCLLVHPLLKRLRHRFSDCAP